MTYLTVTGVDIKSGGVRPPSLIRPWFNASITCFVENNVFKYYFWWKSTQFKHKRLFIWMEKLVRLSADKQQLFCNRAYLQLGGAPLCGFVPGADFSTTEDVTFTFRSDATSEAPGFRVFWSISTGNDSSRSVVVFLATHNLVNSYRQLNCGTYTFLSIFNPRIFSLTSHYVKRSPGSYITSVVIFPPQKPVRFNKMYCMDFFS